MLEKLGITPGPWHVMKDGFGKKPNHPTVYATNDDLNYVAKCSDYATVKPVNNMANAQLIAAAPEMLESLIETVIIIEGTPSIIIGSIEYELRNAYIPIIKKATGKTWSEIKEILLTLKPLTMED